MSTEKRLRFTREEIDIILKSVKKYSKKRIAFQQAYNDMGKTHSIDVIASKYYRDLAPVKKKVDGQPVVKKQRKKRKKKGFWSKLLNSLFNIR